METLTVATAMLLTGSVMGWLSVVFLLRDRMAYPHAVIGLRKNGQNVAVNSVRDLCHTITARWGKLGGLWKAVRHLPVVPMALRPVILRSQSVGCIRRR